MLMRSLLLDGISFTNSFHGSKTDLIYETQKERPVKREASSSTGSATAKHVARIQQSSMKRLCFFIWSAH